MRVWIDIDNAPHVLVLRPIIDELKKRGHDVMVTARDFGQTIGLLEHYGIDYVKVGIHPGPNKFKKIQGLLDRSLKLYNIMKDKKIDVAFAHASRGIVIPSLLFKIPLIIMYDYEYVFDWLFKKFATKILIPHVIPEDKLRELRYPLHKVVKYPGIKEELYVYESKIDPEIPKILNLDQSKIIVTVRPPADMAHYYNKKSGFLMEEILKYLIKNKEKINVIFIPRTVEQIKKFEWFVSQDFVRIPPRALDGPSLLYFSDVMIGGGGTMNREAALLGVETYSIFTGKKGSVDKFLEQQGKLHFIKDKDEIEKITLEKRDKKLIKDNTKKEDLLHFIVNQIESANG
ncbi:MAG: DUF354 domain-containing protein [Candidatus Diapherotrites archaeon]|nr:DUF354 domain-containing protein [Candidatus Diapherotrites archaeon]